MFLYIEMFMLFTSTFAIMIVAGIDTAETAGNIANLLFLMCLIFCGVLATKDSFPHFWIFMYRVSPFTYLVEGMLGVAIANTNVVCADNELLSFNPPSGQTCGQYMSNYIAAAGGYLINEDATIGCSFCSVSKTNVFLAQFDIYYSHKWRDFGLLWIFVIFNAAAAVAIYYVARVPKNTGKEQASEPEEPEKNAAPGNTEKRSRRSESS